MRKGQRKIVEKDYEGAHHYLTRSRDIVNELLVTLRVEEGNKVAQNLRSLYVFMIGQIIEANLKKDAAIVDEVLTVAQNLRDGWTQLKISKPNCASRSTKLLLMKRSSDSARFGCTDEVFDMLMEAPRRGA